MISFFPGSADWWYNTAISNIFNTAEIPKFGIQGQFVAVWAYDWVGSVFIQDIVINPIFAKGAVEQV